MKARAFQADYLFPVSSLPVKNGILITDSDGKILRLAEQEEREKVIREYSIGEIEKFNGILCPGFINSHCHLELSHLRGKFSRRKGLPFFLREVMKRREEFSEDEVKLKMLEADREMLKNGIVAVGDICNNEQSFEIKSRSEIRYHNFIELFGLQSANAEKVISNGAALLDRSAMLNIPASLVPHAPYSCSAELLRRIFQYRNNGFPLLSMHNQETESENLFFMNATGPLYDFINSIGSGVEEKPSGMNSTETALRELDQHSKLMLVHNTFSKEEDLETIQKKHPLTWFCLCPNANEFIENRLPDIRMMMRRKVSLLMGTDSLASNDFLSILGEMKTIRRSFPEIGFADMLPWATQNAADFFGFSKFGSFEEGKTPGVNLVTGLTGSSFRLSDDSAVRRLI